MIEIQDLGEIMTMLASRVRHFEGDDIVVLSHPEVQNIIAALEVSKVLNALLDDLKARNAGLQWKLDNYRMSRDPPPFAHTLGEMK